MHTHSWLCLLAVLHDFDGDFVVSGGSEARVDVGTICFVFFVSFAGISCVAQV